MTDKIPTPMPRKIPPFAFFNEQNIYKPPLYIILNKIILVTNILYYVIYRFIF